MFSILESIWQVIQLVWQFFINTISSLIVLLTMIPTYIAYLVDLVAVVPDFATTFFIAGIGLTVFLFMLNRTE